MAQRGSLFYSAGLARLALRGGRSTRSRTSSRRTVCCPHPRGPDPQPKPASPRTPLFDPIAAHAAIPKEAPTPQPSVYTQGAVNIAKATTRAAAAAAISGMIDGSDSGDGGSGD